MGNTVTENDSGWVRTMTAAELRDPVLGQAVKEFLMVLVGGAIVLALLASREGDGRHHDRLGFRLPVCPGEMGHEAARGDCLDIREPEG